MRIKYIPSIIPLNNCTERYCCSTAGRSIWASFRSAGARNGSDKPVTFAVQGIVTDE